MKHILSIQSHVAYGYVGNRSAVFPLQRMGHEVTAVHTVQFSNHTGYQKWTGDVFDAGHIRRVIDGLAEMGVLAKIDALLTGYLGSDENGHIILETLEKLPRGTKWICDPVMGDSDRGFFVKETIPPFFRDHAMLKTHVMTPNLFELEYLSGMTISTTDQAKSACRVLHNKGVEIVLLTSFLSPTMESGRIGMIASHKDGVAYIATTPQLDLDPLPNGAGDCTAALFTGHLLADAKINIALEKTAASIFAVFEKTKRQGGRELALIQAQDDFISPTHHFTAQLL